MASGSAIRVEIPAALRESFEEILFEGLGELQFSSTAAPDGRLFLWVDSRDLAAALAALAALGAPPSALSTFEERSTDWVAESAALRRAVLVDRYLFDPHDADLATAPPPGVRRLFLPAVRAFGTGSHESTRLAVRLLLAEDVRGARVLDVGCGTGTLAFVAALEGARRIVALDVDLHAAFATREQARANGISGVFTFAGPLEALRQGAGFDFVIANMIHEEIEPIFPMLRAHLAPGGRLLCSGQLVERREEWEELLGKSGFRRVRSIQENEWLGTAWISSNE